MTARQARQHVNLRPPVPEIAHVIYRTRRPTTCRPLWDPRNGVVQGPVQFLVDPADVPLHEIESEGVVPRCVAARQDVAQPAHLLVGQYAVLRRSGRDRARPEGASQVILTPQQRPGGAQDCRILHHVAMPRDQQARVERSDGIECPHPARWIAEEREGNGVDQYVAEDDGSLGWQVKEEVARGDGAIRVTHLHHASTKIEVGRIANGTVREGVMHRSLLRQEGS